MRKGALPFLALLTIFVLSFTGALSVRPEPYFTDSNKIKFTLTSENGSVSYSEVLIDKVEVNERTTNIYGKDMRLDDQHRNTFTYRANFCADSLHWYVEASNHLGCPLVYSSNYIVDLTSQLLGYPYSMSVGDTLQPAYAIEIVKGAAQYERQVRFINRKVMAAESVFIGNVSYQAFRIECKMVNISVADYGVLGKIPTQIENTFVEWFVPSKGVVKSERKSKTGTTSLLLQ